MGSSLWSVLSPARHRFRRLSLLRPKRGLKTSWRAPDWCYVDGAARARGTPKAGRARKEKTSPSAAQPCLGCTRERCGGVCNAAGSNEVVRRAIPRRVEWWRDTRTHAYTADGSSKGRVGEGSSKILGPEITATPPLTSPHRVCADRPPPSGLHDRHSATNRPTSPPSIPS